MSCLPTLTAKLSALAAVLQGVLLFSYLVAFFHMIGRMMDKVSTLEPVSKLKISM